MLTTERGAWMMPPHRGMWIPPGIEHEVRMLGSVSMRSIYIEPGASNVPFDHCQVVSISGLMKQLLMEAASLPRLYQEDGRAGAIMSLILHEIPRLTPIPLALPLPADTRLSALCRTFLLHPSSRDTIEDWARGAAMSRRTFTRHFKAQTGDNICLAKTMQDSSRDSTGGVTIPLVIAQLVHSPPIGGTVTSSARTDLPQSGSPRHPGHPVVRKARPRGHRTCGLRACISESGR